MSRILVFAATALAALIAGCASLPPLEGRTETTALADTAGTRIGRAVTPDVAANPGKTGIHALPERHDAFAARVLLAAAADKSLDVQYYIWHGDQVGYLLFEALWQAAERGVRVRLLLDDHNTRRARPDDRRARRASEHRGAPLQPVRAARRPRAQFPDRLHARQPAHAQQVVHRRQPGEHRRRTQHRQRVLRRGRRRRLRRPRRDRRRPGRARGVEAVRSLLEQSVRLSGGELRGRARAGRRRQPRGQVRRDARRPGIRRVPRGGARDVRSCAICSAGNSRSNGRTPRSCTTTRPRRSTRPPGPTCCSFRSSCGRSVGRRRRSISSRPTSCLATRAPRRWRAGEQGREGAHLHQLPGIVRCECRARGLCEAPRGSAPCGGPALRAQDDGGAGRASREGQVRIELVGGLAREDFRRGPPPHLRRLVQLRPALGAAEHRDGPRDRQPERSRSSSPSVSTPPRPWLRTRSGSGPTVAAWNGSSGPLRAKRVTTPSRERTGSNAGASTSTRFSRSIGCSSPRLDRLDSCCGCCSFC